MKPPPAPPAPEHNDCARSQVTFRNLLNDTTTIARLALLRLTRRRLRNAVLLGLFLAAAFCCMPFETEVYSQVRSIQTPRLASIAGTLRKWGRFTDTLVFTGGLMIAGLLFRRRDWSTAAAATLLIASLTGLTVASVRGLTGRARPSAQDPNHWIGPTLNPQYQSFPSGHTATSIACASALLASGNLLGWPALISALGIMLASYYKGSHSPSDLMVALGVGGIAGTTMGLSVREWKNRLVRHPTVNPDGARSIPEPTLTVPD